MLGNVIFKTAFKTLGALIIAVLIVFGVWFFAFPQSLATVSESMENYSFAVTCSSLRYSYTGDVYDLARCVDDSIFSEKDKSIVKYGKKLIEHSQFDEVCEYKDEQTANGAYSKYAISYKQYVYGYVSVSVYNRGDLDEAISLAKSATEDIGFEKGNALSTLAIKVAASGSEEDKQKVLTSLEDVSAEGTDEREHLGNIKSILSA
jgi:hypothetical protein